jgi:uncharacterized membrane-anchored protein YhcB (DUF1043 family)
MNEHQPTTAELVNEVATLRSELKATKAELDAQNAKLEIHFTDTKEKDRQTERQLDQHSSRLDHLERRQ